MSTSLSHGKPDRSPLLAEVLDAHGGLENWERVRSLRADIVLGGPFWSMLGWPHAELKLTASLDARREHITLGPFTARDRIAVLDVEPQRLSIETTDGVLVEQRDDPRSSFPPFDPPTTRWDPIQVAYFLSAAHWNYLTQPFSFTYPGVEVREIEPWDEGGQTWRRLAVRFPETNANHNADQLVYYDTEFMLRRMDYAPEVTANSPVAHYTHDPKTFHGFVFPTRRRIHSRDADGIADQSLATITLDVAQVTWRRNGPMGTTTGADPVEPTQTPVDIPMQPRMMANQRRREEPTVDALRTPDSRFEKLAGYPFAPHYLEVAAHDTPSLRMHYVDEGPPDGLPVVLLHGEPTWSYLYRTMIPPLAQAGHRVLAPDLVGFGRSDKPSRIEDYTYLRHVEWVTSWFNSLDLHDVTLFGQDWGSLIGLRIAAEQGQRIARLVVANGFLPTAQQATPIAFRAWRAFARHSPVLPAGRLVAVGTVNKVPAEVRAGYDAPFPGASYQAGARAFPRLVPTTPNDPAVRANRAAWDALGHWEKPFLAVFGARDPIFWRADRLLIEHIPGAAGQPHDRIRGSHFVQEDCGPDLAARILAWDAPRR